VAEAVQIGLEAAAGKNLEVFSPTIGRQLLERGLIDEIDLQIAPVLLGAGIRPVRQSRRRAPSDSSCSTARTPQPQ
jgi:dihydrofolate reductase